MKPTFNAADIENVYLRRGYLIMVLPLVITLYCVLMMYVLTRDVVRCIWDVFAYRAPSDVRAMIHTAYRHAWNGRDKQ